MQKHLSYLMGAETIDDAALEALGVEIVGKSGSGSRMLKIPEAALPQYTELIKEKLTPGYWNEIVGPEEIVFVFKFADGHAEEYTLSAQNEREIDKLCAEFNDEPPEKTANVYKYLSENDFYHDFMLDHYAELIKR